MPVYLLLTEPPPHRPRRPLAAVFTHADTPEAALLSPVARGAVAVLAVQAEPGIPLDQLIGHALSDEDLFRVGATVEAPRCPFCGGRARLRRPDGEFGPDGEWDDTPGGPGYHVRCWNCDADGPPGWSAADALASWAARP